MRCAACTTAAVALALLLAPAAATAQTGGSAAAWKAEIEQLYSSGKYREAVDIARSAVALAEQQQGPDHPDLAQPLEQLASLYYLLGRFGEAEPLYARSLAMREAALGPDHPDVAVTLNSLAVLLHAQSRFDAAEPLFKRALAIREGVLGPGHADVATSLNNLAVLAAATGRYAEAERSYQRSLQIREKVLGPEAQGVGESLNNLAMLYESQGRYADAEPLLLRSLAIRQRAMAPAHEGAVLPRARHDFAVTLNNLAGLYQTQGRYAAAEQAFNGVATLLELVLGPEHADLATAFNNLAVVYRAQGRYADAEAYYQRALGIWQQALGPHHPLVAIAFDNLAQLHYAQARFAEAEPLYARGLAIRERAFGPDHPEVGSSLNNLAVRALAARDWTGAVQFWRRSTALVVRRTQRGAPSHALPTGKAKSEAQRASHQFWSLIKALNRWRSAPSEGDAEAPPFAETFQAAQWATASEAADALAKMAARGAKGDPALAVMVRERQDLVDEWQRRDASRTATVAQEPGKRDHAAEAVNLNRLATIDQRIGAIDARLVAEFPDYAAFASPLPLSVEVVRAHLGANEALLLFLDTPELHPLKEETFVWVVTKATARWARSDLGRMALTEAVAALRCGLDATLWREAEAQDKCLRLLDGAKPQQAPSHDGFVTILPFDLGRAHALYQALLAPVEDLIKGKHLIIVPAGPLTSLSFNVLVSARADAPVPRTLAEYRKVAWLGTRQPISMLPSVAALKSLRQSAKTNRAQNAYLGIGNPLLEGLPQDQRWGEYYKSQAELARAKQQCPPSWARRSSVAAARPPLALANVFRGGRVDIEEVRAWTPLPETADELCEVGRRLGVDESDILLGSGATETALKGLSTQGQLANYRIVHFATHGAVVGQVGGLAEPGLLLTPPAKGTSDAALLEQDDGYLTASEIAALKLDADWVVLSACNTAGAGGDTAEPLSGMARSFLYAGARALLVSHWEVGSQAAVKLTTRAFAELRNKPRLGRAEALRLSMRALIDAGTAVEAHPSQWAPFVLLGEGAAPQ